jgi:acetyltransferase-like isoleucine patch superfamily enzyme
MRNKLSKFFGNGHHSKLDDNLYMNENIEYSNFQIGQYTYGRPKIYSSDQITKLTIGKFCSIAGNVTILLGGEHRIDWVTTYPFNVLFPEAKQYEGHPSTKGDIAIGNDVWIGRGAVILSGVTIGDGAVIAAGCVVAKSVEPYAIVGGNPQRLIRKRFSSEQIDALLNIRWWDWPIDSVIGALPFLLNNNIDEFIARYSK